MLTHRGLTDACNHDFCHVSTLFHGQLAAVTHIGGVIDLRAAGDIIGGGGARSRRAAILSVTTQRKASEPAPEPKETIRIRSPGSAISRMAVRPMMAAPA